MGAQHESNGRARSVPVHGGTCTVSPREGVVRIDQSPWRHMHALAWLFTLGSLLAALYGAATGWQYTTGTGEAIG